MSRLIPPCTPPQALHNERQRKEREFDLAAIVHLNPVADPIGPGPPSWKRWRRGTIIVEDQTEESAAVPLASSPHTPLRRGMRFRVHHLIEKNHFSQSLWTKFSPCCRPVGMSKRIPPCTPPQALHNEHQNKEREFDLAVIDHVNPVADPIGPGPPSWKRWRRGTIIVQDQTVESAAVPLASSPHTPLSCSMRSRVHHLIEKNRFSQSLWTKFSPPPPRVGMSKRIPPCTPPQGLRNERQNKEKEFDLAAIVHPNPVQDPIEPSPPSWKRWRRGTIIVEDKVVRSPAVPLAASPHTPLSCGMHSRTVPLIEKFPFSQSV